MSSKGCDREEEPSLETRLHSATSGRNTSSEIAVQIPINAIVQDRTLTRKQTPAPKKKSKSTKKTPVNICMVAVV
jgi:hypothetical protein